MNLISTLTISRVTIPVVVFTAVDARLTGETGMSRVEWASALVASEAFAVPSLVHGNEVIAIDNLETAAAAQSR